MTDERREKILRLLDITGMNPSTLADQLANNMVASLESQFGNSPEAPQAIDVVRKTLNEHRISFVDDVLAAYAEMLDEGDVDHALDFFTSATGTKINAASKPLLQRAMKAADEWRGRAMSAIEPDLLRILGTATGDAPSSLEPPLPPAA